MTGRRCIVGVASEAVAANRTCPALRLGWSLCSSETRRIVPCDRFAASVLRRIVTFATVPLHGRPTRTIRNLAPRDSPSAPASADYVFASDRGPGRPYCRACPDCRDEQRPRLGDCRSRRTICWRAWCRARPGVRSDWRVHRISGMPSVVGLPNNDTQGGAQARGTSHSVAGGVADGAVRLAAGAGSVGREANHRRGRRREQR